MKRKLYAVLLVICLIFTQMPLMSFADAAPARTEEPVSYGVTALYVGGVDALETPQGDGWSFDAETSTLTLNNCNISSGSYREPRIPEMGLPATDSLIYAEGQLILELVGDNYVEREITTVSSEDTSFRAITVYADNPILYDAPEEDQWALYIKGKGSLTTGVAFDHAVIENSYWIPNSYGIAVDMTNGLDLRGLKDGGTITIYGGDKEVPRTYNIKAMNNGPVWNENYTVVAYQDLQGTMENDNGYNWNNNDAWNFKLITAPTYVNASGILIILNDNPDEGEGWIWENEVLTLDGGSGTLQMQGIEFGTNVDKAKIKLESDVLLDASELADTVPLISQCVGGKLEIDAGNYMLTCKSSHLTYDSWAQVYYEFSGTAIDTKGDLLITGGKVEAIGATDEDGGYDIYMSGNLTVQNAELICPSGEIHVYDEYNEENELYGGDIIVENGVIDAQTDYKWGMALYAEGGITIKNSDVTAESVYMGMRAVDIIDISDGSVVNAVGASDRGISSDAELHISESNVNAQGGVTAVIVGDYYNEMPDESILTLTDVEMIMPENGEIKAFEYRYNPDDSYYLGRVSIFDGEEQAKVVQIAAATASCTHKDTMVINVLTQTCFEEGYSGDLICLECEEVLQYGEVIPADGEHKYDNGTITTKATCTTAGTKTYKCTNGKCSHTKTEGYADANAHTWNTDYTIDKAATCSTAGSKSIHCKRCNAKKSVTTIAKKGHNYSSTYTVEKKATTSAAGSKSKRCSRCDAKTSVTSIPKISTVKLSASSYTYSGGIKSPSVIVKDSKGNSLKKDTDYTVTIPKGRKNAGIYTYKITFKGSYSGTKELKLTIKPKKIDKMTLSKSTYVYSGSAKKPTVTVKAGTLKPISKKTKSNSNATITYAKGRMKVGKYKVTVKGKGNYTGTLTKTFKINPKPTKITKLTKAKKAFTVKWSKKTTQTTGYQIYYTTSTTRKNGKTVTISKTSTTSKKISNLKSKKKYYVWVRTYKTVDGTKYYSSWSARKSVITK